MFPFKLNRKLDYQALVLYRYDIQKNVAETEFNQFFFYFRDLYKLEFNCMSFDTISFNKDYIFKTETGFAKIKEIGWDKIVSITLYETDFRKINQNYSLKFSITNNPSIVTIFLARSINFNIKSFLIAFQGSFKPDYGFYYFTDNSEWATAYAYPKYFKIANVDGISKLSKKDNEIFGKRHREVIGGLFRDIYYANVLNEQHVNKQVGSITLDEWSRINEIGKLELIYKNVYLWTLDKKEIEIARKLLL